MDIITTQDRSVCTETSDTKSKNANDTEKINNSSIKMEKKKSESKKLRKKLNEIEEQNESLSKLINDKNTEIQELKKSVNSLNEVINSVPINELRCNSSIASAKILELSSKNRQLRAELEKTKNRLSHKDQQLQKLEKELENRKENKEQNKNKSLSAPEELHNKISALQQKLFETRNKNVELNAQLKLAQKCLQQEIGDNFNLNLLANQSAATGWRGRAQQILHLQQKLKELQEKLDNRNITDNHHALNPTNSYTLKERPHVSKTEILHRNKVETLETEIDNLKSVLEEQRSKVLALKVRNKTLNDEIAQYKLKASTLEEKTDFNSLNINTLNEKLNEQKLKYDQKISEIIKEKANLLKENKEISLNKEILDDKLQQMEACLKEKNQSIEELETLIKKLEQDLKAICGGFLFSCRELRKEEFITILDSLEAEKNSILDHNKTLNDRLNDERCKNDSLTDVIAKQKIRISRLENKIRELEHDLDLQCEKKKRTQRIAEYTASLSSMSCSSSVSSFTFENSTLTSAESRNDLPKNTQHDLNDLKNRLELTNEKVVMLKEKLDYLMAEKENDIKTFNEIIANSKNILLDTILAHRNSNISVELQ